jgi:CRP/FNR family transcriptional regulator, cyclic AMP receptor protein
MSELLAVTTAVDLLRDADPETRASFAALGNCRTFPRNNILFHHGDPCHSAFVIVSGRVKLVLAAEDGRELALEVLGPGAICGLVAALDGGPCLGTAITLQHARIGIIPSERLQAWLAERPLLYRRLALILACMLRQSCERTGMQALLNVKRRIHATLLDIARQEGIALPGSLDVVAPRPTHQELAERIGSSRVVVSRILKELLDEDATISVEGRTLRVKLRAVEAAGDPGLFS